MVGDNPSAPRRPSKPQMTQAQQVLLVGRIDKVRLAHNNGASIEQIQEDFAGSVFDIKELVSSTVDAVDILTTLVVHGSMQIELAAHLGVWQQKQETLRNVLAIQAGSGLQAHNLHPKSLENLCRGLSKELVAKIDGVDYSAPVKSTAQASAPKFESAADILAFMNKRPEPRPVQSGPVSRVWSYATHGKTMAELLNILPESIGKSVTPAKTGRPKDKDESVKTARPKDKDESDGTVKAARPKDKDESDGGAKVGKNPTKAALIKHLQSLNGETDARLRDDLVKGLQGATTVLAALELMDEAGLPRP